MKRRRDLGTISDILEKHAELIEYQRVVIQAYEDMLTSEIPVGRVELMHCATCNLPVNDATTEEFDSLVFMCDECGVRPWCGRTACKEPQLDDYEAGPEWDERTLCLACAKAIFKE